MTPHYKLKPGAELGSLASSFVHVNGKSGGDRIPFMLQRDEGFMMSRFLHTCG